MAYGVTSAIKGAGSVADDVANSTDDVAKNVADKTDDVAKGANSVTGTQTATKTLPKYPGNDPSKCPGKGFEWRGSGDPASGKGSWYNPATGESLHPDLGHGEPIGPHWDYTSPTGESYRLFPNGNSSLK